MPGIIGDKERLDSWKEIATYLRRDQRTAIRWSKQNGLPVHRIPGSTSVFAIREELDAWLTARSPEADSLSVLPIQSTNERPEKPSDPDIRQITSRPKHAALHARPYQWLVMSASVGIVLASVALALVFSKKNGTLPGNSGTRALPSFDIQHVILSQDFDRFRIRTEAFLDVRPEIGRRKDHLFEWRNIPGQVRGISDVAAMSGGFGHSLAVKTDGTVWAWGWENLSDTEPKHKHPYPEQIHTSKPVHVQTVAGGGNHSLALADDGTVWAWGSNRVFELGDGTTLPRRTPVQVAGLADVIAIAAFDSYSLALKKNGTVWIWGGDSRTDRVLHKVPTQVEGLEDVTSLTAGEGFFLALKSDGTVWSWGDNRDGCLGEGTNRDRRIPGRVASLSGVKAISAGAHHVAALKQDGSVWTWGQNAYGELGDGSLTDHRIPALVPGLDRVVAIAAGPQHTFALREDGVVWAWGQNYYGVLGDGTPQDRPTPKPVQGLSGVAAIATGGQQGLARKNDGSVWTWGWNEYGQLGEHAVREMQDSGTMVRTVDYRPRSGPSWALSGNGLPWILFDQSARRILLQPGRFATLAWGASVGYDVVSDGPYAITGAFQRANSFLGSGDGVDVLILVDCDEAHPLWKKHIGSRDTESKAFALNTTLRRGQVLRFVVFSAQSDKDGNSDETSLEAAVDRQ